ncbi:MAG: hypothetical protein GJ676_08620 [Rhodobacteraceae bacterium]|nr:hypothetical protein [Paracoccaceae bacterium]
MSETRHLNDLDIDEFESGLLAVARHFLSGVEDPGSHGWQRAFAVSVERWGEGRGLSIAFQLHKILLATEQCRATGMAFHDPLCLERRQRATEDEQALLEMLHYMRRDNTDAARDAVDRLTKGWRDPHVIRAGLAFAARFPSGQGRPQRAAGRPLLKVV